MNDPLTRELGGILLSDKGPPTVRKFFVRVRYFLGAERDFLKNPRVCTKPSAANIAEKQAHSARTTTAPRTALIPR